jgi:hypothetical protein
MTAWDSETARTRLLVSIAGALIVVFVFWLGHYKAAVWIGLATLISLWVIKRWCGGFYFPGREPHSSHKFIPLNPFCAIGGSPEEMHLVTLGHPVTLMISLLLCTDRALRGCAPTGKPPSFPSARFTQTERHGKRKLMRRQLRYRRAGSQPGNCAVTSIAFAGDGAQQLHEEAATSPMSPSFRSPNWYLIISFGYPAAARAGRESHQSLYPCSSGFQ